MNTPGSSTLSDEQSDWFLRNHGVRYTHVQANSGVASRRDRRAHKKFLRRRADQGRAYGVPR